MQRQDSLTDQIETVASVASSRGLTSVSAWLRGGPSPTYEGLWLGRKIAVEQGCYDADDWIRRHTVGAQAGGGLLSRQDVPAPTGGHPEFNPSG